MPELSTAALAYLGDAVLELLVRGEAVRRSPDSGSAELNAFAHERVTATAQSNALERVLAAMTDDEAAVFKRGRNNSHGNIPRSASAAQYRRATGFECVFGWLYLRGENERIRALYNAAYGCDEGGSI